MTLRLTEAESDALRAQADVEGRSMQDVARQAVRDYIERESHTEQVKRSGERMIARWGDVLDRLGSV